MVKNGTLASPATARAISVLPVPGGPTSSTPRGIVPPRRWNLPGSRRNSTISCRSCLASSTPATSSNVTRPCASVSSLARDLPKPIALPAPPCIWRDRKIHTPISAMNGSHETSSDTNHGTLSPRRPRGDLDALAVEALHQRRIVRRIGLEAAAVGEGAVNFRPLDQRRRAPGRARPRSEAARTRCPDEDVPLTRVLEQREQRQQQQNDDHPEGEIAQIGVHPESFRRRLSGQVRPVLAIGADGGDRRCPA